MITAFVEKNSVVGEIIEIKDKTDMEEMFYFYSSYKNQLTYFNKDKTIVIFCIDYRYSFNYEHKLSELCLYVDEYCLYKQAI